MPSAFVPVRTGETGLYKWYVLAVLALANCFNAIDRTIVNILVEPIRREFGFSDLQMGAIAGLGFALFYTIIGIPIARQADRGNRKNLLAVGVLLWSGMTALTGRAFGFWSLLGARIGVGVGEATCYPTAYPLISDYFLKSKRPRAIALFQLGLYGGIGIGAAVAGVVSQKYGWRTAFFVLGTPGMLLSILIFLTVREPVRGMSDDVVPATRYAGGLRDMLVLLVGNPRFFLLIVTAAALTTASAVLASWGPSFLMRLHGVSQGQVGLLVGPVIGAGGILGTLVGGFAGTALAKPGAADRAPLLVPLWAILPAIPASLLFIFAPTLPLVLAGGATTAFLIASHNGPLIAVAVGMVAPNNRGLASSLIVMAQLLVGFGFGPLIVGGISDIFAASQGTASLRIGLLLVPTALLIGWCSTFLAYRRIGTVA